MKSRRWLIWSGPSPCQEQIGGVRGVADVLADRRTERDLVRRCRLAPRQRLAIFELEAGVEEILSGFGQLEHVFGHRLRQQSRLIVGRGAVPAELDFAMPPRRHAGAKLQGVTGHPIELGALLERRIGLVFDLQLPVVDPVR